MSDVKLLVNFTVASGLMHNPEHYMACYTLTGSGTETASPTT